MHQLRHGRARGPQLLRRRRGRRNRREFADPGTPAAATAESSFAIHRDPDVPHTMWAARLLIGLVVAVAVVFGGIVVWRALPKSSGSVPARQAVCRRGVFDLSERHLRRPHAEGIREEPGPFLILGHTVGTRFAAAKVETELVEVVTGRTADRMHAKSLRQAGDLAEAMPAGRQAGRGPELRTGRVAYGSCGGNGRLSTRSGRAPTNRSSACASPWSGGGS